MTLSQLANEYRDASTACRTRAKEVEKLINVPESASELFNNRRRITILQAMTRETASIAKHLESYERVNLSRSRKNQHPRKCCAESNSTY